MATKGKDLISKVKKLLTKEDSKKASLVLAKKISEINGVDMLLKKLKKQLSVLENLDVSEIAEIYSDDLEIKDELLDEVEEDDE